MKLGDISIRQLLIKYKLYTYEIGQINQFINILCKSPETIEIRLLPKKNRTEQELAIEIRDLILKCDARNKDYDCEICEELMRIGFDTTNFHTGESYLYSVEGYPIFETDCYREPTRRRKR